MTKACGILFCYNEEHIIQDTLLYYLKQGIDIVVFDNESSDRSPQIIRSLKECRAYAGQIIDIVVIKTDGFEWQKILKTACDYMHRRLNHYPWIMLIDADTYYDSPVRGMNLLEYLGSAAKLGFNVLDGKLIEFYPTDKDDPAIISPIERMKHFKNGVPWQEVTQQKIFQYHPSIDFYTNYGHICKRPQARRLKSIKFLFKHYSWCSYEHGLKKIFKERIPRYVERERTGNLNLHWHYYENLPTKTDLVKNARDMEHFDYKQHSINLPYFWWLAGLDRLGVYDLWCKSLEFIKYLPKRVYLKSKPLIKVLPSCWQERVKHLRFNLMLHLRLHQPSSPHAFKPPEEYHFLMNNYCNADCIFCNQIIPHSQHEDITLETFKEMLSHIPVDETKHFCFSGGGDPLLSPDLINILTYVNAHYPHVTMSIKTNGLLLKKLSRPLAQIKNLRIELSLHGMEENNDFILQRKATQTIFEGLSLLNTLCSEYGNYIKKDFCVVISRLNIEDVPLLIQKAAQEKAEVVKLFPCQYYPEKLDSQLKKEDAIVYHKELYKDVIKQSRKIADTLDVKLYAPQLDMKYYDLLHRNCNFPWNMLLVDWSGKVYPCPGWEVIAHHKVASGQEYFGNILHEPLTLFWNNTSWIKLRRTVMGKKDEGCLSECVNCRCYNPYPDGERIAGVQFGHVL